MPSPLEAKIDRIELMLAEILNRLNAPAPDQSRLRAEQELALGRLQGKSVAEIIKARNESAARKTTKGKR